MPVCILRHLQAEAVPLLPADFQAHLALPPAGQCHAHVRSAAEPNHVYMLAGVPLSHRILRNVQAGTLLVVCAGA